MCMGSSLDVYYSLVLLPDASNAWEAVSVFDTAYAGAVDRSDGRGTQRWFLYAGSTNNSGVDDTDSCIGLAYLGAQSAGGEFKPYWAYRSNLQLQAV